MKLQPFSFGIAYGTAITVFMIMEKFIYKMAMCRFGMCGRMMSKVTVGGKPVMPMAMRMGFGYMFFKIVAVFAFAFVAGWLLATVYNMLVEK